MLQLFARPWMVLAACIVAATVAASTHADEGVGLSTIARWDFGMGEDPQADRWPDGWTRLKDTQHPGFIPAYIDKKSIEGVDAHEAERFRRWMTKVYLGLKSGRSPWEIIPEATPPQVERFVERTLLDPYLRVDMDGSSAEIYSPRLTVDDDSLYGMQVDIRSDSGDFEAKAHLRFFDSSGNQVFQTDTSTVPADGEWRTVRTSGAYESPAKISTLQVVLTVDPTSAKSMRGSYGFDRIRVVQMPKIRMNVDRVTRIYRPGETVNLRFLASGLKQGATRVDLALFDHDGVQVASESKELNSADEVLVSHGDRGAPSERTALKRWEGSCDWRLTGLAPGYYELVTQLKRANAVFYERSEHFAVLAETKISDLDPRFGWTLDDRAYRWTMDHLLSLIREGGTGYVKLPIWFDASQPRQQDRVCEMVDRLHAAGIHSVGVIFEPLKLANDAPMGTKNTIRSLTTEDPTIWQPMLEPVFRAMCLRMVDFQIGYDHDTQFGSNPRYATSIEWIKKILKRYGSEPTLALSKNPWLNPGAHSGVDRWQWTPEEPLAASEWGAVMPEPTNRYPDWTSVNPLPADQYSLATRVQDLYARMVASIRPGEGRTTTAWISDPFSDATGFLSPNGTPREMFLPYRMLIDAMKNKEYIGELELLGGSRNALIATENDSCLVVWSIKPTTEQIFLGDDVHAVDAWGRKVPIESVETPFGTEHRFAVNKWPIIIRGVDTKVALWRMGLALEQQRLDSLVGQPQRVNIRFNNPFAFDVSGRIELVAPHVLANEVDASMFDADARQEINVPIDVLLRPDATSQDTPVRVVANLNTSPPKRFSVTKTLHIGNDDVEFETNYRINAANELWLDIDAINHNKIPVSFDCQLFIPNRRNERVQISGVDDRKTRTIVLPNASELINQALWLRCAQVGTRRILNYRILIEPEAPPSETGSLDEAVSKP